MLAERLQTAKGALAAAQAETRRLKREKKASEEARDAAQASLAITSSARDLLVRAADLKRSEITARIEAITTKALHAVLGKTDYTFAFKWEEKRGTMEAAPILRGTTEDGEPYESDIIDSHGGGIVDVVAFTLRYVMARLTPDLLPVIVFDEPFRHVASAHMEGVARMLRLLCKKTGWRMLICTHQEKLIQAADRVYRVTHDGVQSSFTKDAAVEQ